VVFLLFGENNGLKSTCIKSSNPQFFILYGYIRFWLFTAASIAAILHFFPDFFPFFAPSERATTSETGFLW
jgi:hypothetical protein